MFRDMSISNTTMDEFRQHLQATGVRDCINFSSPVLDLCFYIYEVYFFSFTSLFGCSIYFEVTLYMQLKVVVGGWTVGTLVKSFY